MPTHIRALCSWQATSLLPRDVHQITPCFRHQFDPLDIGQPDYDQLALDLINGLDSWDSAATSHEMKVRLYEIGGERPNRPKATASKYVGASTATLSWPPEIACCLSFYGGSNAPQNRGRLYIPAWLVSGAPSGDRPSSTIRQKCADLVPIFASLGGANVDWIVWSPTRSSATKVTNWFVDDEWDVQRRRGYRPTMRLSGTTSG